MAKRKGLIWSLAAAAALAAAAFGWWIASPWWTLRGMRDAALARDAGALSAFVDYPALRRSTRRQLRAELGPVGGRLAGAAAAAAIRPETLRLLFVAGVAPGGPGSEKGGGGKAAPSSARWSVTREGIARFRAEAEGGPTLVFGRRGLSWKLQEVILK